MKQVILNLGGKKTGINLETHPTQIINTNISLILNIHVCFKIITNNTKVLNKTHIKILKNQLTKNEMIKHVNSAYFTIMANINIWY